MVWHTHSTTKLGAAIRNFPSGWVSQLHRGKVKVLLAYWFLQLFICVNRDRSAQTSVRFCYCTYDLILFRIYSRACVWLTLNARFLRNNHQKVRNALVIQRPYTHSLEPSIVSTSLSLRTLFITSYDFWNAFYKCLGTPHRNQQTLVSWHGHGMQKPIIEEVSQIWKPLWWNAAISVYRIMTICVIRRIEFLRGKPLSTTWQRCRCQFIFFGDLLYYLSLQPNNVCCVLVPTSSANKFLV